MPALLTSASIDLNLFFATSAIFAAVAASAMLPSTSASLSDSSNSSRLGDVSRIRHHVVTAIQKRLHHACSNSLRAAGHDYCFLRIRHFSPFIARTMAYLKTLLFNEIDRIRCDQVIKSTFRGGNNWTMVSTILWYRVARRTVVSAAADI